MKENLLEFYVNKYCFLKSPEMLDLEFIPPILRRRMSILDKMILSSMNTVFNDSIQNIVFSSQYGEVERLLKIINQYLENNEVSPNTFSGSVHNYSVGFFLLNKQKSIPYTALSAYEHSISNGLLSAVISKYDNVLFCYADSNNDSFNAFAVNLTKIPNPKLPKYVIKLEKNQYLKDKFNDYEAIFSGSINLIKTPIYTIERVSNG